MTEKVGEEQREKWESIRDRVIDERVKRECSKREQEMAKERERGGGH